MECKQNAYPAESGGSTEKPTTTPALTEELHRRHQPSTDQTHQTESRQKNSPGPKNSSAQQDQSLKHRQILKKANIQLRNLPGFGLATKKLQGLSHILDKIPICWNYRRELRQRRASGNFWPRRRKRKERPVSSELAGGDPVRRTSSDEAVETITTSGGAEPGLGKLKPAQDRAPTRFRLGLDQDLGFGLALGPSGQPSGPSPSEKAQNFPKWASAKAQGPSAHPKHLPTLQGFLTSLTDSSDASTLSLLQILLLTRQESLPRTVGEALLSGKPSTRRSLPSGSPSLAEELTTERTASAYDGAPYQ
ncbi:hypothetical protein SLA2020_280940 [Shorea laevis]